MTDAPPISHIVQALRRYRIRFGAESYMQADVEQILIRESITYAREHRLGANEIDFLAEHGIGIECKVNGSPAAVMEQLTRYAEFDDVHALLLCTSRHTHRFRTTEICGKPFQVLFIAGKL